MERFKPREVTNPYGKHWNLHTSGLMSFGTGENTPEFRGFEPQKVNGLVVMAYEGTSLPLQPSPKLIQFYNDLEQASVQTGVKYTFAGPPNTSYFPPHITLFSRPFSDASKETNRAHATRFRQSQVVKNALATLRGITIDLDRVIIDAGGSVLFVASQLPEELVRARRQFQLASEASADITLPPMDFSHLAHMVVARVEKVNNTDRLKENRANILRVVRNARRAMRDNPYQFTMRTFSSGNPLTSVYPTMGYKVRKFD